MSPWSASTAKAGALSARCAGDSPRKRGGPQINLRDDTALEAPRFRTLLSRRRCLVVADGWYEWHPQPDGTRLPCYIRMPEGGPFGFAGVWNRTPDGPACTIMTCPASETIAKVHDRMPVIARPPYENWLDGPLRDSHRVERATQDLRRRT